MRMRDREEAMDIALIPELPTRVGMPGASRQAELGWQPCTETGVIIALLVFNISEA